MSRDGYLPDDVSESDLPGANDFDHAEGCPAGEDGPELYSECGGLGACECYPDTWIGRLRRWWSPPDCAVVKDPDCTCPRADELAADAAEARAEARAEMDHA